MTREINLFEEAIYRGDDGLVGMDGSGNDWEFPQQLGSTAIEEIIIEEALPEES